MTKNRDDFAAATAETANTLPFPNLNPTVLDFAAAYQKIVAVGYEARDTHPELSDAVGKAVIGFYDFQHAMAVALNLPNQFGAKQMNKMSLKSAAREKSMVKAAEALGQAVRIGRDAIPAELAKQVESYIDIVRPPQRPTARACREAAATGAGYGLIFSSVRKR